MTILSFKLVAILCCLLSQTAWGSAVEVRRARTEGMTAPMGLDTNQPRFSWALQSKEQNVMQQGYQIQVASSPELLAQGRADLWDSGRVNSDASQWIVYAGAPLKSNQRAWWRVKSYTNKGESEWSGAEMFSVGLLKESHWRGQWIGMDRAAEWDSDTQWSRLSARYLRKEFKTSKAIKQATVHIAGVGMYELFINGERVGEQVLAPVPTDYRKRITYNSFDVTELLSADNAIGVSLGTGRFYTMRQNYKPYKITNFGYPKLRLNLVVEYEDGSRDVIASDNSWRLTAKGAIRSNNEYDGEEYDARMELIGWTEFGYDDKEWSPAERVSIPSGKLQGATTPNMKVVKKIEPKSVTKVGNKYILDMGQNMAGWVRMTVPALKSGDTVKMRFAELLQDNGELYVANLRDARVTDTYVSNGTDKGRSWAPVFVYHGFRYVEVTGYPNPRVEDFVGEVVSDEMESLSQFETSNATLNKIFNNAWWGILGNYKGMPIDCPQRNERQPWLGDRTTGCWGESYLFDNAALYAKWTTDIVDAQRADGVIPDVAPAYWNYYSDNVTWPAALPFACDMLYTQFGDTEPIAKNYDAIVKWLDHVAEEYMRDGIITKDRYGDWCVPPESLELIHSRDPARQTDGALLSTAYYIKVLQTMQRFCTVLNKETERAEWRLMEEQMKEAFNKKFLTVKRGTSQATGHTLYPDSVYYGNNTGTANILPLAFGIVTEENREEVVKNVITSIITTNKGHISCGVIGVQWLMRELSANGFADVAFLLATNKTYPSWGYMVENGATTIWELWNGNTANPAMNSANHVMLLGDLLPWCFENLAGIKSDRSEVAFKHIVMKPNFEIQDLSFVNSSYTTPYGEVVSKWRKNLQELTWSVEIPANTTAELHLPDGRVERIGSGAYTFKSSIPTPNKAVVINQFLYEESSFPECHGATIVELKNGDLVASFFGGTKERNPDCNIWVSRKPKGKTEWTAPEIAADGVFLLSDSKAKIAGITAESTPAEAGAVSKNFKGNMAQARRKACWNPVLFELPNGELLLFYKIGLKVSDWTGWLVRSKDGGRTWSQREALPEGFLGPIKNRPELINGRIICPSSTEGNGWNLHFEISDDMGKTWRKTAPTEVDLDVPTQNRVAGVQSVDDQEAGEAIKSEGARPIFAIQPSILRHKDGRLQVLARTRNGRLATSWSSDDGETWSKVTLTDVANNNSGTDAVTLKDGRHVLIYNDFQTLDGTPKGVRTPLNWAVSSDGVTWQNVAILEDSPISQYSYPSIIEGRDGRLHAVYTWRRQRIAYMEIGPTF